MLFLPLAWQGLMPKPPLGTCGEFPPLSFLFPGETCAGAQPVYEGRCPEEGPGWSPREGAGRAFVI